MKRDNHIIMMKYKVFLPVRKLWKAVSTFVESLADVSMKDRPCFSSKIENIMKFDKEGENYRMVSDNTLIHSYDKVQCG